MFKWINKVFRSNENEINESIFNEIKDDPLLIKMVKDDDVGRAHMHTIGKFDSFDGFIPFDEHDVDTYELTDKAYAILKAAIDGDLSIRALAKTVGVSKDTVRRWLNLLEQLNLVILDVYLGVTIVTTRSLVKRVKITKDVFKYKTILKKVT